MKKNVLLWTLLCLSAMTAQAQGDMDTFISRLMAKMTIEEKIGQLNLQVGGDITTGQPQDTEIGRLIVEGKVGGVFNVKGREKIKALQLAAVKESRLGIPLLVGMDVIHGYETIFPIPLALSCSWDEAAVEEAAGIAAKEATADGICWTFSPMVDIALDARWGRIAEGNGEDPFLGSRLAAAYVRGYQQSSLSPRPLMACVKHYALYGAAEAGRDYNTVDMSHWRMYNQYLPPYKAAVEAGVGSVMSAFNIVDGQHATANRWLLTDVLRNEWKFNGFVVTDYGSIGEMEVHGFGDLKQNAAQALRAGTDMDMCSQGFLKTLTASLADGTITADDINQACRRILEAKYKLGLFDNPYQYVADSKQPSPDIYSDENRKKARDIAAETFVLLKNKDNVLPLAKTGTIALIGPLADTRANMAGTWCVAYTPDRYSTLKEAMQRAVGSRAKVVCAQGSNLTRDAVLQEDAEFGRTIPRVDDKEAHDEAMRVARDADVIVCAMGECADFSGEASSRAFLEMPDVQRELLADLVTLGKPVVLLHFSGRPTILTWENEHVDAILNVWFGGSEAGDAICDVLFGDKVPSGKLTTSFPQAVGQLPLYYNHLRTGRPVDDDADKFSKFASNYLDVRNDPLYPFGYGLSYTTFDYSPVTLSADHMTADGQLTATVSVTNTGRYDADEIVQLYIHDRYASTARPVKELKGFQRIHLKKGEQREVTFTITPDLLRFYNAQLEWVLEPGTFDLMVGPDSKHLKTTTFEVTK